MGLIGFLCQREKLIQPKSTGIRFVLSFATEPQSDQGKCKNFRLGAPIKPFTEKKNRNPSFKKINQVNGMQWCLPSYSAAACSTLCIFV